VRATTTSTSPGGASRGLDEIAGHNLVGNAVRYCNTGGRVELHAEVLDPAEPYSVSIAVLNTGPPVPAELATKLFSKYARGANGKRGFGLYFCRLACEAHGGRISYRTHEEGPSFQVQLPGRG
jgi:signal transduction histidine kinase